MGQGEWNDNEHQRKVGVPKEWKNNLMFREDGLEVLRHKGCLNGLYGMELGNNIRMSFFEKIHAMGTNDLQGTSGDALEIILFSLLVELHG
jgi:hypothetical protein